MLSTVTLKNGMRIATYNLPSLKSLHIRISVKGGSLVEDKTKNGVAHFMEHMLVQGIPSFPNVEEFSGFIEGLAGSYGAYTKGLVVSFYLTVPETHIEAAIKIASETFFAPLFVEQAIEKERQAVIEEIKQKMDSHWYKISRYFINSRFKKDHPLTYDGGGSLETMHTLTRENLKDYWQTYFHPKNTSVLVTGKFSETKLVELLEKYFAQVPNNKTFTGFPQMSNADLAERKVSIREDRELQTCYFDVTFPSLGMFDTLKNRLKQNLALVIFGQLRNSRLFKLLRYQKGLVYDVSAGSSQHPGLGYVYISSQVSPKHLNEVVRLIKEEIQKFIISGPTEEELSFAKNYLTSQWLMTFDHPSSLTAWIEDHLLWEEKILTPEDYASILQSFTRKDILSLMKTKWDFSKLQLTIQGPVEDTEKERENFKTLLSSLK